MRNDAKGQKTTSQTWSDITEVASLFTEEKGGHPFYVIVRGEAGDDRMWWFVFVVSIASIPLAEKMAQGAPKVVDPL
jgi:hypothetical protein